MVRSEEAAQDLFQDASVKIWNNLAKYDPEKGQLFTWLLQITRNVALDKIRTKKFQRAGKSESLETTVSNNIGYSEQTVTTDVGLQQQLNRLDPKYRQIIELLYFQGYTQREVTEEMGIPLGTVKSRVKAGMKELRRLLGRNTLVVISFLIVAAQLFIQFVNRL